MTNGAAVTRGDHPSHVPGQDDLPVDGPITLRVAHARRTGGSKGRSAAVAVVAAEPPPPPK